MKTYLITDGENCITVSENELFDYEGWSILQCFNPEQLEKYSYEDYLADMEDEGICY